MAQTPDVLICEVGPRDGLQSVARTMPTADKNAWIDALHAAGLLRIDAGISTAFSCTIQGRVPEDDVVQLCAQLITARKPLASGLPGETLHGMIAEAGLPKEFVRGSAFA